MDAKEWLEEIAKLDELPYNKIAELEQLRALATSCTVSMDSEPVQTSTSDSRGIIVAKILDLESEIQASADAALEEKQRRIQLIEQIKDALQYTVIHNHYVLYKSFDEIAADKNYTTDWIKRVHKKGLTAMQEILTENSPL